MSDKTTLLMTCDTLQEATLVQGNLQNIGIPSFLANENYGSLYPGATWNPAFGIGVMVFEDDLEKAKILMGADQKSLPACPNCASQNITAKPGNVSRLTAVLQALFMTLLMRTNKIKYHCNKCNTDFTL